MSSNPSFHVVIPCAGTGSRSGLIRPKQYTPIAGLPMVVHSLNMFNSRPWLGHGVVVVAPDDEEMVTILESHPQSKFQIFNTGGQTRAESVLAGLKALCSLGVDGNDWVLVHDAARCLITTELIEKLVNECQFDPVGGLLALPLPDTLKSDDKGRVASTLARQGKWLAQTPQIFRMNVLYEALLRAGEQVTDESSAIEFLGMSPLLVEGAAFNFKVTYPQDAQMAEALLNSRLKPKGQS